MNEQPRDGTVDVDVGGEGEGVATGKVTGIETPPASQHDQKRTNRDWAVWYAEHGWLVFPLKPRDKTPLTTHGLWDASKDREQLEVWWRQWPDANIGTPVPDGCLVVDVDVRNGGTLRQLGGMPATVRAKTGGGGWHLWTTVPAEVKLAGKFHDLTGIDVKKVGGYVVLPPSIHPSGNTYQWEIPPFGDIPIVPLPPHLLDRVRVQPRASRPLREPAADPDADVDPDSDRAADYFLERAKERAADDGRNNTGLWLACQLRDNGVSESDAERIMREYQADVENWADPPYTEQEMLGSLRQAYSRAAREPTTFSEPKPAPATVVSVAEATGDTAALERARMLPEAEALSDLGDAALLEAQYCRVLKHTSELGWLAYHDGKWDAADGEKAARRHVRSVLDGLAQEAATECGTDHGKRLFAHAHQACNRVPYITQAAESFEGLSAHQADFDANPWLLGVKNGVVDLRTGRLLDHDATLMLTHQSPVAYRPHAKALRWQRFLHEVFAGDEAHIRFVQKAVGYSLTGDTREQVFFLCHGSGANGKSVFLSTISYVAGDYAAPLNPEEFMARFNRAETQPNLVGVVGRRLVTSQEPKDGSVGEKAPALDAARVKWLTGGDAIQIRTLHAKPFFYQPVWKLWLAMNRLPDIRDDSDGIWRRLRPIPFLVSFRGREDPTLTATLREEAEAEGILAWAVDGARLWLADGLGMVGAVQKDADAYRAREDPLFAFIQSELVRDAGQQVSQQDVLSRYNSWRQGVLDDYDAPYFTPRDFGRALEAHGFQRRRVDGHRELLDYRLKAPGDTAQVAQVAQKGQIAGTPYSSNPIAIPANSPLCAINATDSAITCPTCGATRTVAAGASAALATPAERKAVGRSSQRGSGRPVAMKPYLLDPAVCHHLALRQPDGTYHCDGCDTTWLTPPEGVPTSLAA